MQTLSADDYVDLQMNQVESYMKGVRTGTIIANEWIKLAVEKVSNDKQGSEFEYREKEVAKLFEYYSIINAETLDGQVGQFQMIPFQSFFLSTMFGFYHDKSDLRKYNEGFLYMGRGGGKSGLIGPLMPYFLYLDDYNPFPEIIFIANTKDQANRTFTAVQQTILSTPDLLDILDFNYRQIYIKPNKSLGFAEIVPSEGLKLQGYKLVSAVLDEIHGYKDNTLYTGVKRGLDKKKNPMLFMTSTAGDIDKDFCKDRIEYSEKVLQGEIKDESLFPLLYTLDKGDLKNWTDEKVWQKANPGLGTVKKIKPMRDNLNKAKYFATDRYEFITYDLNVYTDSVVNWIPPEYLDKILKKIEDAEVEKKECYIGADFSEVEDLTALAYLFPEEVSPDEWIFKAKIDYIFPDNPERKRRKGNKNLQPWIDDNKIIVCKGSTVIDDQVVLGQVKKADEDYEVLGFGYDVRAGAKLAEFVKQIVPPKYVVPIHQGYGLSPAIKEIQKLIHTGRLIIEDNPVTKWNFANVVLEPDGYKNWRLNKKKSKEAIDGVVALCNAYKLFEEMIYPTTSNSLVNDMSLLSKS